MTIVVRKASATVITTKKEAERKEEKEVEKNLKNKRNKTISLSLKTQYTSNNLLKYFLDIYLQKI
jgi:hypothetical protein